MEDEHRGKVSDCVIRGVNEGEGVTGCAAREEEKVRVTGNNG